jgi:hypothetical protein
MKEINRARLKIIVPLAVLIMSSSTHGYAQAIEGAFEVGVESGGCLFIASGGHESIGGFILFTEPHADYYLSEKFSVGVTGFFYRSVESDLSRPFLTFGGAYGQVNYHFNPRRRLSPYVGARIGIFNPNSDAVFSFGGQIGLKYFAARQFSINGQLALTTSPSQRGTLFLSCLGLGFSYFIQ